MNEPLYPQVKVKLVGLDGNAFSIIGRCVKEAQKHLDKSIIDSFKVEAMSGNYDHLLMTCMKYFDCR